MNKENARIIIDAGHGGSDTGAVGNGIVEKDLALNISTYMYDRFRELGVPVRMVRTTDETLSPEERVEKIMNAWGKNSDYNLISNHIHSGDVDGAEVIYALRDTDRLPNRILQEISKEGQNILLPYQKRLPSNPPKDADFILRDTAPLHSVIVQYGNLNSNGDDVSQLKKDYKLYAEAVVRAVLLYLGIPYTPPAGSSYYTVKKGDSLWTIAQQFNTTVDLLKANNNLTSNSLQIGQVLKIPSPIEKPDTGETFLYTVKLNDSLYKIASQFNVTVQDIIDLNNLKNTNLQIGQQLLIPVKGGSTPPPSSDTIYIVKKGDSLWSIASQYNITVDELRNYNNLSTSILNIGQELKIPKGNVSPPTTEETKYVVKVNDSLWKIANQFGTTVDAIRSKNNLKTDLLSIGQVLIIPNSNSNSPTRYTVKSGDSLWKIANQFNTTVDAIRSKNNLKTDTLTIGQILYI